MKNVILAAYFFPPMASVSWMRVTKFAKYLPRMGWNPLVVSVDGRYYPKTVDDGLPPEVKSLDVQRLGYRPRIPVFVVKLFYPIYVLWHAVLSRKRMDALVIFGSPFHTFLVAPMVRVFARLPVVLDLRDGWSTWHEQTSRGRKDAFKNRFRRLIEKIGFSQACTAVFATESLRRQYSERFPKYRHKFVTVTNGFDPDDFESPEEERVEVEDIILLAGKFLFYTPQVAQWLLELLADHPEWRFVYIGEESEEVLALAHRVGAGAQVDVRGYLPYRDVIKEIRRAKVCVTTNSFSEGLGTKVFDYLALQKRVLCFVPAVSEIAEQFEGAPGVTVCREPHSRETVAAGLKQALASTGAGRMHAAAYSRETKTAELAGILDSCVFHTDIVQQ